MGIFRHSFALSLVTTVFALVFPGSLFAAGEGVDPAWHAAVSEFLQMKEVPAADLALRTDVDTELDREFDAAYELYRELRAQVDREAGKESRDGWQAGRAPFAFALFGGSVVLAAPPAPCYPLTSTQYNLIPFVSAKPCGLVVPSHRPDVPEYLRNYLARLQHAGPAH